VLHSFDVTPEKISLAIDAADVPKGAEEKIPFTPRSKKILEYALREALSLGHNYIGTGHVLLGVIREGEGLANEILAKLDVDEDALREATIRELNGPVGRTELNQVRPNRPSSPGERQPSGSPSAETDKVDAPDNESEAIESVPTHGDRPATLDELGRARLAAVLAERMRRVRGEDTEARPGNARERRSKLAKEATEARKTGSFMVHVHAPWGAGKSSLLNFLAADLRNRVPMPGLSGSISLRRLARVVFRLRQPRNPDLLRWIVVEFSAWEHQRLIAPWWWLLTAVQRSCSRELWRVHRGRWLWFWARDIAWRLWNARAAFVTLLLLAGAFALAWAFDWFGLLDESLSTVRTVILTATATIALAGTIFGLVRGMSRWLAVGSADGAVRFLKRSHDPLGVYRQRFRWLVRSCRQPITVFIDDLDRCKPQYVVELLEGIQTLFASEPVAYVVAADREWLCESFANAYRDFESSVGSPARPLGFLFLEKTFQISLEIPPMSHEDRNRFWGGLLRIGPNGDGRPETSAQGSAASDELAGAKTQTEIEEGVDDLIRRGADRDEVLQAAVRRLNAPEVEAAQLEQLLRQFAPLLEGNPRSMKRLMNAYGIERDRLVRDGHLLTKTERRQLVLLTILRLRWPLFAEHLRRHPNDVRFFDGASAPGNHPYVALFRDTAVRRLFDGTEVDVRIEAAQLEQFP